MRLARNGSGVLLLVGAAFVLSGGGCAKDDKKGTTPGPEAKAKDAKDGKKDLKTVAHAGWWCQEHGVPEHLCSLCLPDGEEKFKKAGDWCKIHDRAQSQCFKCDPSLYKKYEAMYVAKYDKKPEPPPKEEFEK
jgi:hypothetical protein